MIETPAAIFDVREIAAHPRVSRAGDGNERPSPRSFDPRSSLGRHPLVPHLATALLAARGSGKVILDGVYNDVKDPDGFRAECRQGMEMGFDGKTLIHPSQVEPCNDTWAPSAEEVEHAERVIAAFDDAGGAGTRRGDRGRQDDREPARGQRSPHTGDRIGDHLARLSGSLSRAGCQSWERGQLAPLPVRTTPIVRRQILMSWNSDQLST